MSSGRCLDAGGKLGPGGFEVIADPGPKIFRCRRAVNGAFQLDIEDAVGLTTQIKKIESEIEDEL